MAEGEASPPPPAAAPSPPTPPPTARRFETAGKATAELHEHYGNWTAGLGKFGLQIAFALMAANWALHGTHTAILQNPWAKWSMVFAVSYLGMVLLMLGAMVQLSWERREYADADKERWGKEFDANADTPSAWPYTPKIERIGRLMQLIHVALPLFSGLLLMISIFVWSPATGTDGIGKIDSRSCCAIGGDDISAIRRSVEAFVAGSGGQLEPTTTVVRGESGLTLPGWPIFAIGVFIFLVGAGVLAMFRGTPGKAVGTTLVTLGLTCSAGGLSLVKEVKIESLFTIKTDKLFDYVHQEVANLGGTGPERLGYIDRFKLGDDRMLEPKPNKLALVDKDDEMVKAMFDTWSNGRKAHMNAVLLVIGSTDRLPIEGAKRHQFDANVSLARARAEVVKKALLDVCRIRPPCDLNDEQIITLVSGPLHTPPDAESPPASRREGFPEDRRVDVWALWTRKPVDAPKR